MTTKYKDLVVKTQDKYIDLMISIKRNHGRTLDPAAGYGSFSDRIKNCINIEVNNELCRSDFDALDFFSYSDSNKFDTIIGDLPFIQSVDIPSETKKLISKYKFSKNANLYLYFIEKCLDHLNDGGEMILLTPRSFLKATSSTRLNERLFNSGTITHYFDLSDPIYYAGSSSNSIIWRFEKGSYTRKTTTFHGDREFVNSSGQILFLNLVDSVIRLGDLFKVRVGAISGANEIYANDEFGNVDFVCSHTAVSGKTRRMIWCPDKPNDYLSNFKSSLMRRKVASFNERNWWTWGRSDYQSDSKRIYVNGITRNKKPFYIHDCRRYDSSVLALFPINENIDISMAKDLLNLINWSDMGFVHDGRYLFTQKALEDVYLPLKFKLLNK
jgi:adenine-specific DNA-methyltransferase